MVGNLYKTKFGPRLRRTFVSLRKSRGQSEFQAALRAWGGAIQFRSRDKGAIIISTRREHAAVGEQRRRVEAASIIEAGCGRPISGGRIVNFRASQRVPAAKATCNSTVPSKSDVAVW